MKILNHSGPEREIWREGVEVQMRNSSLNGSRSICIFEQFIVPGEGAPVHYHAVEEVFEVREGMAEVYLTDRTLTMETNQTLLIPPGLRHGFKNIGTGTLHMRATLASPSFEAAYDDETEVARRWVLQEHQTTPNMNGR